MHYTLLKCNYCSRTRTYYDGIVYIRCSGSKYAIVAEIRSNIVQQPNPMNRVQDIVYL